jgi:hypothetical protein
VPGPFFTPAHEPRKQGRDHDAHDEHGINFQKVFVTVAGVVVAVTVGGRQPIQRAKSPC